MSPTPHRLPADNLRPGVSIRDLTLLIFVSGWKIILGITLSILFLTGIYLELTQKQYEASVILKLGQVAVIPDPWKIGKDFLVENIEDIDNVRRNMQSPEFYNAVVKLLEWNVDDRQAQLLKLSYKSFNFTGRQLKIVLRGVSPENTRKAMDATLQILIGNHNSKIERIVDLNKKKLLEVELRIAETKAFLRVLEKLERQNRSEMALPILLKVSNDEKVSLRGLIDLKKVVEDVAFSQINTPTVVLEPVLVSDIPVYPNAKRVWFFAVLMGLIIGLLLVTLRLFYDLNRSPKNNP